MAEVVTVPRALRTDHVGEGVIAQLIAHDELPADFYFRLLAFKDDDKGTWGDWKPSTREEIARQDVLAALGLGEPSPESSTYLRGELPRCAMLPYGGSPRKVVRQLDTHYYILDDVFETAAMLGRSRHLARQSWETCFQYADSSVFVDAFSKLQDPTESANRQKSRYRWMLAHAAVRGDVVLELYQDETAPNISPARRELLHYMLLDNHPELGV